MQLGAAGKTLGVAQRKQLGTRASIPKAVQAEVGDAKSRYSKRSTAMGSSIVPRAGDSGLQWEMRESLEEGANLTRRDLILSTGASCCSLLQEYLSK